MSDERVKTDALDDQSAAIAAKRISPPVATCHTGEIATSATTSASQSAQSAASPIACDNPSEPATGSGGEPSQATPRLSYEALEQHCRNVEGTFKLHNQNSYTNLET